MPNAFVEARPKGRPEGAAIEGYAVENGNDRELKRTDTQAEAIAWCKANGYTPLVARVRNLNDKKKPDHWRGV